MATLIGTAGPDTLDGTGGADSITGLGSNDSLVGLDGADSLRGGSGNDTLLGGDGNDTLLGGTDSDSLDGGAGADRMVGSSGNDTMILSGSDTANGDAGSDFFEIGGAGSRVIGGSGDDTITFTTSGTYTVTNQGGGFFGVTGPGGSATVQSIQFIQGPTGNQAFGTGSFFVCFAGGTRIRTERGETPVEHLRAGDRVVTVSGRGAPLQPILWIGRRHVALAGHPNAEAIAPIRIRAGALADNTPSRDLLVSPDHCLFLDGALVPARLLVNGTSIVAETGLAEVTYYHVELEAHDVLLAEGAAAESWLDCDNRAWFENAPVAQLAVAGTLAEAGTGWDASRACAPLLHGGDQLAAIRAAIAARATTAGARAAA
jgi:hypothetical protein